MKTAQASLETRSVRGSALQAELDVPCFALSLPGHDETPMLSIQDLSIHALAAWLHQQVKEIGLNNFTLVGHSLGGSVAAAFASQYPGMVSQLVLVDPSGDPSAIPESQRNGLLEALASPAYGEVIGGYWQQIRKWSRLE